MSKGEQRSGLDPEKRPRWTLPAVIYPVADPRGSIASPIEDPIWLEPLPNEWLADEAANPEARYLMQERITLAFQRRWGVSGFLPASADH